MNKKMNEVTATQVMAAILPINQLIPNLNAGGCGVFAALFAEKLQSCGYEPELIELWGDSLEHCLFGVNSFESWKKEYRSNIQNLEKAKNDHLSPDICNAEIPTHICIKIDEFYFDSTSFNISDGESVTLGRGYNFKIIGQVPIDAIDYVSLKNRGGIWNDKYNPKDNNKVRNFLDSALSFLND